MKTKQMYSLKKTCHRFRKAILTYGAIGLPNCFRSFPKGCCVDTSLLLGKFLDDTGFGLFFYTHGHFDNKNHAWLEKDGLIVDITADQFNGINKPVIVTGYSKFHSNFKQDVNRPYHHSFKSHNCFAIYILLPHYRNILKYV